jgi:hypothetical protein
MNAADAFRCKEKDSLLCCAQAGRKAPDRWVIPDKKASQGPVLLLLDCRQGGSYTGFLLGTAVLRGQDLRLARLRGLSCALSRVDGALHALQDGRERFGRFRRLERCLPGLVQLNQAPVTKRPSCSSKLVASCASKSTLASGIRVGGEVGFVGEAEAGWVSAVPALARIRSKTIRMIGCIA